MKKYDTIVVFDDYCEEYLFVCELTADDVAKAEKEFSLYMRCKGETYDADTNKHPSVKNFFKLYFGEWDDGFMKAPDKYICTNKNVANRFMKLAQQLAYHDRYNQTFCDVKQNGKIIDIGYGDY